MLSEQIKKLSEQEVELELHLNDLTIESKKARKRLGIVKKAKEQLIRMQEKFEGNDEQEEVYDSTNISE